MQDTKTSVLVTGISGNLGLRLLAQLSDFSVIGVDLKPPTTDVPLRFFEMDFGEEESCRTLTHLIREYRPSAVVHLAFVIDPIRTDILDVQRMWRINVAGTARVMEAITEVNRISTTVRKFIFPSSVSAYGPDLPGMVDENFPLGAHTLPYAVHKRESDQVVQARANALGHCSTYILRPHIFTGASVQNYLVGAFRGTPTGRGKWGAKLRAQGKRLPCMLPLGRRYLDNGIQFIHVDDMARVIAHILRRKDPDPSMTILNVAGRGMPLTFRRCIEIAGSRLVRLPGKASCRLALKILWDLGISGIPPDALPYMTGTYTMNTDRLHTFLGADYPRVIQHTVEEAFADSFKDMPTAPHTPAAVKTDRAFSS